MKTILLWYLGICFAIMLIIMIARTVLIRKLYSIKEDKIFADGMGIEILSALVCIPFPFKIPAPENPATHNIVKQINKLKNYYWWLALSVVSVVVLVNVVKNFF